MSHSSYADTFSKVASRKQSAKPEKQKRPPPLSVRVSDEEKALLKRQAGNRSINGYIRHKLFGDAVNPKSVRRSPSVDKEALAKALGALGQSRLSSNLNQIAKAANMGALPVSPELVAELNRACVDIQAMRRYLIAALGIKPEA